VQLPKQLPKQSPQTYYESLVCEKGCITEVWYTAGGDEFSKYRRQHTRALNV
jgi:hypothetical protein